MATGITFEQVAAVADTLAASGEDFSLREVRAELGRGSLTTIQKHVATWQEQRRQTVVRPATAATAAAELQRVFFAEIDREVSAARAVFGRDLALLIEARDAAAQEIDQMSAQIEQQANQLAAIESAWQQQAGRITQLEAELATVREEAKQDRSSAEQAKQACAKAEQRLEVLPKIEAEVERLRVALDASMAQAVAAEKLAGVTAEKLAGAEARLADAQVKEQQVVAKLAEAEKEGRAEREQATQFRLRAVEAESKAREWEKDAAAATARANEAERRAREAEQAAAELRGKLEALKDAQGGSEAR